MRPRRIAFAAGGTAGHVLPALAVAQEARALDPSAEILFVGTGAGFEVRLVPRANFELLLVPGAPFQRTSALGKLKALSSLPFGVAAARSVLREREIEAVIGFGGYATAPMLLAARSLGLRTALHESNAELGLANRRLAPLVDVVYLGFPGSRTGEDGRAIGTPVRREILEAASAPRVTGRGARVLVLSGSDPSPFLDERVPSLLARLAAETGPVTAWHQCGGAPERVTAEYLRAGIDASVSPFFDDIAACYAGADLVIARSGGGVLAELAAVGRPSLLVPLADAAEGHQSRNAELFAERSGALRCEEGAWDERLLVAPLARLLADEEARERASRGARAVAAPRAATRLAAEILSG
jgi:UDP-N-acetylglucosamine--N-acetylmuramyl-(pentapeptide) pyrophosphoryl-undecaprenol N-acetylglucosamine transferase